MAQDEAVLCRRKAAEEGDARSQFLFGILYQHGRGVPRSDEEAMKWFRLAADQGLSDAQFILAAMLQSGRGGRGGNVAEALVWYRKAAEQGCAPAQFSLGILYEGGHGVPADTTQANMWFRMAADQGHDGAQSKLGIETERGALMARMALMRDFPDAAELLHQIVALCGNGNALVASHRTLAKVMEVEDVDIVTAAVSILRNERWIDVRQIGDSPSVNAYIIGVRAEWIRTSDKIRTANFNAAVLITDDEQPDCMDLGEQSPLRKQFMVSPTKSPGSAGETSGASG
ncbi:MAG: tetratricopeptide repeat protein [Rhodospirillaceae bacterium]